MLSCFCFGSCTWQECAIILKSILQKNNFYNNFSRSCLFCCLAVCLAVCLSFCQVVCPSVQPSFPVSVHLSVFVYVCLSSLSVRSPVCWSFSLFGCLAGCPVCPSFCPSTQTPIHTTQVHSWRLCHSHRPT